MDPILVEQARARLTEMKQAAEDLTDALGLPRDATYDVLAMMYGEEPSPLAMLQSTVQAQVSADTIKDRIFQLSEGFLNIQMKNQLATFHAMRKELETLPLEILRGILSQRPKAFQGLGFVGSQHLFPVISAISWAVINYPNLSKTSTPEQIQAAIASEAEARGCSRALSNALALYIQRRLTDPTAI